MIDSIESYLKTKKRNYQQLFTETLAITTAEGAGEAWKNANQKGGDTNQKCQ